LNAWSFGCFKSAELGEVFVACFGEGCLRADAGGSQVFWKLAETGTDLMVKNLMPVENNPDKSGFWRLAK